MLQQHAFGPAPTCALGPLVSTNLSQISSDYPEPCSFLHLVRSCLLIPCGLGPLADAEVIDHALVRCLAIEVARVTEPTARIGSMALTQVGLSLQTACPRPGGTQADSPEFLRALGARPESTRSDHRPSEREVPETPLYVPA